MKLLLHLCILTTLLVIPFVNAQDNIERAEIIFDIRADNSVLQTNTFYFFPLLNVSKINYTVAGDIRDVSVSDETQQLEYSINDNVIEISLRKPVQSLTIKYIANNLVFRSDSIGQFFTEFSFENQIRNMRADVILPAGFSVYANNTRPEPSEITLDGQRTIVIWKLNYVKDVLFSVKFASPQFENGTFGIIAVVLLLVAIIIYIHFRKKSKEEFFRGFRDDEKKTIEYLEDKKTALQSDLQREFKFSRAKSTRIVMQLEQKGLVRKQKYGRTNKLYWLKSENIFDSVKGLIKTLRTSRLNR